MKGLTPRITEKAYRSIPEDAKSSATYTFVVDTALDKGQIKTLVEKEHKVSVLDVRTITMKGRPRRFKNIVGKTKAFAKAMVTLKAGDRIAAFDIADKKEDKE